VVGSLVKARTEDGGQAEVWSAEKMVACPMTYRSNQPETRLKRLRRLRVCESARDDIDSCTMASPWEISSVSYEIHCVSAAARHG